MSLPTTDNDWDLKSGSRDYFDNNPATPTWSPNQDASPQLKDVARNLSQKLGVPINDFLGLSGGYIYEQSRAYKGPHAGIDFSAGAGTSIKAVVSGTIENVSNQAGGSFIAVRGRDGKRWIYGHLSNSRGLVANRDTIEAGEEVGKVFNLGISSHLHLEVHTDFNAPKTGFFQNSGNPASIALLKQQTMSPLQAFSQLNNGGGSNPKPPTQGDDIITGNSASNNLTGLGGNDKIYGQDGNDTLYGEAGNDYLNGGAGNDYLDGYASFNRADFDTLEGGTGADTFVLGNTRQGMFYQGNGQATISDYNFRDDYIQLRGNASQYRLINQGNDKLIQTTGGDTLAIVKNVPDLSFNVTSSRRDFQFV
ncbi:MULTISPECIES: peptidoglycan DD-metalloendopeptidase family protein [unclassified Microcoleus]|uniref:peptidoglycan DD-metalloendopeptidase family protein n=1 Tax=unclassified Microcoleus TaxID=2642155 RepID=UPI002FD25E65